MLNQFSGVIMELEPNKSEQAVCTHLSLHKDAPIPRAVQTVGRTLATPVLGGLHHQYFRA
jgi:hypothetical protein